MKQKLGRKLLSFLLTLAMVIGLMPGMGLTALAYDDDPYASLVGTTTTVKFNDIDWYIIADNSTAVADGTVTLLAKDPIGASKFNNSTDDGNAYSNSEVKKYLDSLTATGGPFKTVTDAITPVTLTIYKYDSTTEVAETIQNAKLWLLSTSEANALTEGVRKCSQASGAQYNYWWLRSPGSGNKAAACVLGAGGVNDTGFSVTYTLGVRPALKLNLSSVIFSSVNLSGGANAAISGGTATQNYFDMGLTRGAMTTVSYTANANYKFPEISELYKTTNGIAVTRTSDTVITVSGTPTATATSIAVPDAVQSSIAVTGISLDKTTAQTIEVNGKVSFTATVEPNDATDKTVKWSVGGTDTDAVKLYTDENCTAEVGADATETLTVYAKGISAGSATVTATSNADSEKTASCDVTVGGPKIDYDIWVGGTRVNSWNADNITGSETPVAIYDVNTNTLTLDGANITTGNAFIDNDEFYYGIYYDGVEDTLNINIASDSTVGGDDISMGIFSQDSIVEITGEGKLTASGTDGGIGSLNGSVFINNCAVTAISSFKAIHGTVKNNIAGTGWGNVEGTGEGTSIETSDAGQTLTYKKVQFPAAHTHDEISFQPWTSADSLPTESGSYYLTKDVTLSETWTVRGTNNLCLNGHSINGPTNASNVFNVGTNTTLNLYDCGVTAGTIIARYKNGVAVAPGSTFNMYGGEISGNKDTGVSNVDGTFTMTGGTIRDNGKGVVNQDIFKLSGNPTITNNKSGTDDSAKDNNVSLADNKVITIDGVLSNTTPIGVTMSAPGVFTSGWNDKMSDKTPTDYFTSDDSAYTVQVDGNELKLAVIKTNPTVTAPTAKDLIYNGQPQELVKAGAAKGGTIKYAVTTETAKPADSAYTYDNTSIPAKTDAGTYYVWYKVVGDDNHYDTTPASLTCKIARAQVTVTALDQTVTYGTDITRDLTKISVTGLAEGESVSEVTYLASTTNATNGTPGTITASEVAIVKADQTVSTDNYSISYNTGNLVIERKELTVNATTGLEKTYGEADPEFTYTASGFEYEDTKAGVLSGKLERTTGNNASTYSITQGTLAANDNYTIKFTGADFKINPAAITITADDKSSKYGDDIAELTWKIGGAYVDGDDLGITASTTAEKTSDVDEYAITITWNNNPNYTADLVGGKYTITKADLAITASGYDGAYDGEGHSLTVDIGSSDAVVYYATGELTAENYETAGSTTNPSYTDAGEYTVYFYVATGNYDPVPVTGNKDVVIRKADAEVTTPEANDLTYTGKEQTLITAGETEDGKVLYALGSDTEPSEDAYSEELPTGKEAGTYTVWYKVVADSNHNGKAPVSIAVTIAAKKASSEDISAEADKSSFTFDGEAKAPVVTVKDGDKKLVQGTDYDIEYAGAGNNVYVQSKDAPVETGTYKTVIIFKGNYEGIKEIEFEIAAPIVYTNTEGAGGTWTKGSSDTLSFTFKRSAEDETTLSHFTGILVDGQKVTDFTAKSGSVIVKLNEAFLETLAVGEHTLTAQFDDGEDVEVKFTVKEKTAEEKPADKTDTDTTAPATGDVNRPQMLFILMLISMAGMIILGSLRRKNEGGKNGR